MIFMFDLRMLDHTMLDFGTLDSGPLDWEPWCWTSGQEMLYLRVHYQRMLDRGTLDQ